MKTFATIAVGALAVSVSATPATMGPQKRANQITPVTVKGNGG